MTKFNKWHVRPGGLDDADRERIRELSEKGHSSQAIARRILKHPSTVQWFMYRDGLKAPGYRTCTYTRNGRPVVPFSPAEDEFIEAKRCEGLGPTKIAQLATARFGHQRSLHTINCRLVMLAAREVA